MTFPTPPPTDTDFRQLVGDTYYIYATNLNLTQADIPYPLPGPDGKFPPAPYHIHIQADTVTLAEQLMNRGKDFSLVARRIIVKWTTDDSGATHAPSIDVSGPDPTGKDFAEGDTPPTCGQHPRVC